MSDPQSRVLYELCSMIFHILRPVPFPIPFPAPENSPMMRGGHTAAFYSPATFGLLFLGVSLALMMFGAVIFVIGFVLMPWIVGLVVLFYFAGVVGELERVGRAVVGWGLQQRRDGPG